MIKHIVFWEIKDELDKNQVYFRMKEKLEGLQGAIPGLLSAEVGFNINDGEMNVCLYSTFESNGALSLYQTHPKHMAVKKYVHSVVKARNCVDYAIDKD